MRSDRVTVTRRGSGARTPEGMQFGRYEPPSEFLLTSFYAGIVRYLSGPNRYAPTQTYHTWVKVGAGCSIVRSRRPSGLRKTKHSTNSLAHRTTWLRSDFRYEPPSEFLLTSFYTGIVRYLSGPNRYAPTQTYHSWVKVGAGCSKSEAKRS